MFVSASEPAITRSQIKRLIDEGLVVVNGKTTRPGAKLVAGDIVEVRLPPPAPVKIEPQAIPLDVLYEDAHLIVVNKPAGLVVHPSPGHADGTLVNALLGHSSRFSEVGEPSRPGIVHRLDKDTSGVMVAAKDSQTYEGLVAVFSERELTREYWAVVAPAPSYAKKTFDTLHGRHPVKRKQFSTRVEQGKRAITHCEVVERFGDAAALLRCRLGTGRTHQIRVHLADDHMALIGDPVYRRRYKVAWIGDLGKQLGRQALHAATLGFTHPVTGIPIRCETPLPEDLEFLLDGLRKGIASQKI